MTIKLSGNEDEIRDYVIGRAAECLSKGDAALAKSWIMTATALFPQNDFIKFEAYKMCKCEGNVVEAGKYLFEMFSSESVNEQLFNELSTMVDLLCEDWISTSVPTSINTMSAMQSKTIKTSFYNDLFASLSADQQHELLLLVANRSQNRIKFINLMIFIIKRFPEKIGEHGPKLIEVMIASAKESDTRRSNLIRKVLVFDVLPAVFAEKAPLDLPLQVVYNLMQITLKFYVEQSLKAEILDTGDQENVDVVEMKIKQLFASIAQKLQWQLLIDKSQSIPVMVLYEKITQFMNQFRFSGDGSTSPMDLSSSSVVKSAINADESVNFQILYATVMLFLQCLRKYAKLSQDLILIELSAVAQTKVTATAAKKRKVQLSEPDIFVENEDLKQSFMVATKCLRLLEDNYTLSEGFKKIIADIGLDLQCRCYRSFLIDYKIHAGEYDEVARELLNKKTKTLSTFVQLVSVTSLLRDNNASLQHCIDAVERLQVSVTNPTLPQCDKSEPFSNASRQLLFISTSTGDVTRYVVKVVISILREKVIMSVKPSDNGIGHLIVLAQFDWPAQFELFMTCVNLIKNPKPQQSITKFVYPHFLNYVFIPDVLEEFMSLVQEGFTLEIKGGSSTLPSIKSTSKTMTTRGVNKGFKEEMKAALVLQMKSAKTTIPNELFIEFFKKEIKAFFQHPNK